MERRLQEILKRDAKLATRAIRATHPVTIRRSNLIPRKSLKFVQMPRKPCWKNNKKREKCIISPGPLPRDALVPGIQLFLREARHEHNFYFKFRKEIASRHIFLKLITILCAHSCELTLRIAKSPSRTSWRQPATTRRRSPYSWKQCWRLPREVYGKITVNNRKIT